MITHFIEGIFIAAGVIGGLQPFVELYIENEEPQRLRRLDIGVFRREPQ